MMRKSLIDHDAPATPAGSGNWLDLERLSRVEITSEGAAFPIESALKGSGPGWRAVQAGEQVIRLVFDDPLKVRQIRVAFDEQREPRTQEFTLRWSKDSGRSYQEIVRQQYTFSPPHTTSEAEDYAVDLDGVTALELRIVPDISRGAACASLRALRLA
jgi:hypothetical protein